MDPTIDSSALEPAAASQPDVSQANVDFVVGDKPRFQDETAELLRHRLYAFTLVVSAVLTLALVGTLFQQVTQLFWMRVLVLGILATAGFLLRSERPLSMQALRTIELVCFGLVLLQVSIMISMRLADYAQEGDTAAVTGMRYMFSGAWCVLLLIYGIFIPNSWRRGLSVMIPAALAPYGVFWAIGKFSPAAGAALADVPSLSPVPLPLVAACVAVYGSQTINSARREAFKARQFGQYRLLEKLGSGGMGDVFKAEHVLLKRPCAMKLIRPEAETDTSATSRFEAEVKATAKLTHPNTVEIYDYGHTEDGTFYYVMELLPGLSLDEVVRRHGPLAPNRVVHLLQQIAGALSEAHQAGLIHRDIKPANIFLTQRGGVYDVAKLLDFGLVKESHGSGHADLSSGGSNSGTFSGTPQFMAPEQATSYDRVDGRADLYSLGAVTYFLLTGEPPFQGTKVAQLITAHATAQVVPPTERGVEIPKALENIVLKCLAKRPEDRFVTAAELRSALRSAQEELPWKEQDASQWWKQFVDESTVREEDPDRTRIEQTIDVTVDVDPANTIDG